MTYSSQDRHGLLICLEEACVLSKLYPYRLIADNGMRTTHD